MLKKSTIFRLLTYLFVAIVLGVIFWQPDLALQLTKDLSIETYAPEKESTPDQNSPIQAEKLFQSSRPLTHLSLELAGSEDLVDALNQLSIFLQKQQNIEKIVFLVSPELVFTLPENLKFPVLPEVIRFDPKWSAGDLATVLAREKSEATLLIWLGKKAELSGDQLLNQLFLAHRKNWYDNFEQANLSLLTLSSAELVPKKYFFQQAAQSGSKRVRILFENERIELTAFYAGEPFSTNKVSILFFGDIMLGRYVRTLMERNTLDYGFEKLPPLLWRSADLTVANLEGPVTDQSIKTSKAIAFRFPADTAPLLAKYGFDLLSLANNHALDMGNAGLDSSYALLAENNLIGFGHPRGWDPKSVSFQKINGQKLAFVGLNDVDFKLKKEEILLRISELAKDGNLVIPFIHWGIEYQHRPQKSQIEFAHAMIDAGAYAVVGHHPHVVQGMEIYRDKPIFYSLGNAVFDQYFSPATQQGLTVYFQITPEILEIYLLPINITRSQMILMNAEEKAKFIEQFQEWSDLADPWKTMISTGKLTLQIANKS